MRILINTPDISLLGGVANHYKGLQPYWSQDVKYNFIGGRKGIPGPIILIYDIIKFFLLCLFGKFNVVLLNPSLGKTALKRDALFLKIATWFKIKTVVFIHGWDENIAREIAKNPKLFLSKFNKANSFIVLAKKFKTELENWGIQGEIHVSTTKIDDKLIKEFDIQKKVYNNSLLFLARVEENKGVFQVIEIFRLLKLEFPELKLVIAGNGNAMSKVLDKIREDQLNDIELKGFVSGNELIECFKSSSIYILPTTHGEGMPTSILEAMGFGLPVLTRPVGGIIDFFQDGKMGYLMETTNPNDYVIKIKELFSNQEEIIDIGLNNHNYAKQYFLASKVVETIENILLNV